MVSMGKTFNTLIVFYYQLLPSENFLRPFYFEMSMAALKSFECSLRHRINKIKTFILTNKRHWHNERLHDIYEFAVFEFY